MRVQDSVLMQELAPARPYFYSAFGFSFFINILFLVPPIYMLQIFDRALGSRSETTLWMLTLIMLLLLASMGALDWVRGQIMVRASAKVDELLAERVFQASYRHSLIAGPTQAGSQPLSALTNLRQFLTGSGLNGFFDAPWIPLYIGVMFLFHPYFGYLAVVSALLLTGLAILNQRSTEAKLVEANKEAAWVTEFASENIRNAEVIESMGMMPSFLARWLVRNQAVIRLQSDASEIAVKLTALSKVLRIMLQSLALCMGAYLAMNQKISPGMMVAGSILLGRALAPVDQLVGGWKGFQLARMQFNQLDGLLSANPQKADVMKLPEPIGELSVEGIFMTPPGSNVPVIRGVNFFLEAGSSMAVIGPSAAGKSCLARAVLGIWPVQVGAVRLDGADVRHIDRHQMGPHVGYLPQDIELFRGTIAENICRFGLVESERVVNAAKLVGVHEMILSQPDGYDTVIGQSAGALSAGQRQRVGLARAIYGNPKLVVLDEPNSNLDEAGEQALTETVRRLKQEQVTLIVVTHRRAILSVMDKVLVMQDGQVVRFDDMPDIFSEAALGRQERTPVKT